MIAGTYPRLVLFGAAVLSMAAVSCGSGKTEPAHQAASPTIRVEAATVKRSSEPRSFDAAGTIVAKNAIEITSRVSGRVTELPVVEGSAVRRGDLLIRMDSPELASALAQSRAVEEVALASLEVARRQDARMERLAAKEVVTPRDRELAGLALREAEANHVRAASAREMAEQNYRYAIVRAQSDGVVVRRMVRVGDLAVPGKPLLTVEDSGGREVQLTVSTEASVEPRAGMKARVRFPDDATVDTVVDRVEPSADRHTRVAYLDVDAGDRPTGTFVQVRLEGDRSDPALRVPESSLVRRGSLTGVFVIHENRAVLRWLRFDEDRKVVAGLEDGEQVVVNPSAALKDGSPVEVAR